MPRGRLPKPDAVKRAAGNPGKRRLTTAPAQATGKPASGFAPPAWLEPAALAIWRKLAPDLVRLNFLRATDQQAFARYADHMAAWVKARRTVLKQGEFYDATTVSGEQLKRLHPAVKAAELHEKHLVELEDRFGLTPLARQRILRDQAALPPGTLFAGVERSKDTADSAGPVTPEPPPPASPVGLLMRPVGSLPN